MPVINVDINVPEPFKLLWQTGFEPGEEELYDRLVANFELSDPKYAYLRDKQKHRPRFKIFWGGRGSAKSHSIATYLISKAVTQKNQRILCGREYQTSIKDSVYEVLANKIESFGLTDKFKLTDKNIIFPPTNSMFMFRGFHNNPAGVQSMESITSCWLEEAQRISVASLRKLLPTLRHPKAELICSLNPEDIADPVYAEFCLLTPPHTLKRKVNWDENPYFPEFLDEQRRYMLEHDPESYEHVWMGEPLAISDAIVFRKKAITKSFKTPDTVDRFYFGADFGFANDPSTLIRCFIHEESLWIDYEAYGMHVELDHLPAMYDTVPGARDWPIKGDSSRPETISYLMRQGFRISPAEKWQGSVEDGIAHLKGFKKIFIHERCVHTSEESRTYKYKVDAKTEQVLPIIVDANNHCWDAARYSLDGFIQHRGSHQSWLKFAAALE